MIQLETKDKKMAMRLFLFSKNAGKLAFFFSFLLLSLPLFAGSAMSDGINGYLELNYNQFESKTDTSGDVTQIKSNSFNQLYNLSLMQTIYPNLRLSANGIFEKNITKSTIDNIDTESSTTKIRPLIDLTLRSPLYTAGIGYTRNEKKDTSSVVTNVNEDYKVIFGWRPEDFPSIDMRFGRINTFDKERLIQDTVIDNFALTFKYIPVKDLDLRYEPSQRNTKDKLNKVETNSLTHNGRVTYSSSFINKRVSLFTSYNISHNETKTTTTGSTGEVSFQLFPFSGLSAIDDTPATDPLVLNSAIIDGDLAASAGINIGLPPSGGNTSKRNMGLDFFNNTEMNTLFVWVDKGLPSQIATSFSWDIYTSSDNQNWNLLTTVSPAKFGAFQNRFEINFSNVTTRYIKVVTAPLTLAATIGVPGDFSDIFVTEVQAFIRKSASEVQNEGTFKTTTHLYNADIRTRILDTPSLFYEFSYFLTKTYPSSLKSSTLSNGFSLNHRFSRFFSGNAKAMREDNVKGEENGVNYLYNASITAVPIETLRHTLTYSGSTEKINERSSNKNSIFFNNIAELYKGINVNISEGISFQTQETGEKVKSTVVIFGSTIIPHPNLSLNLNYSKTNIQRSGSNQESSTLTSAEDLGVAYRPFETIYLVISVSRITNDDKIRITQNYAAAWSPFRDGTLQFNFAFNEGLTSDGGKSRLIGPNLRWNISKSMYLDMFYQILKTELTSQTTNTNTSGVTFRMVF